MEVWKLAPTPDAARKLRPSRVAKVLKQHRIRRIDAPEVLRRLRVRSIPVAPGTTQAMRVHIESLGERLAVVRNQLRDISRELDRLIRAWEKRCESTPAPRTVPGRGDPRLPARRRPNRPGHPALGSLRCDPAPRLRRFAMSVRGGPRDPEFRQIHPGRAPPSRSSSSAGSGLSLVARGHATRPHQPSQVRCPAGARPRPCPALRSVADRLLAVACAMLRDQTEYDANHARQRRAA